MSSKYVKILIGLIIGAAVGLVAKEFNLSTFKYGILLALVAVIVTLIYTLTLIRKQKKLNEKVLPSFDLLEKGNVDEFIKINEKYLAEEKDSLSQLKIIMFLISGYDIKKDFETPRRLLLELDEKSLPKQARVVYNASLAMVSFKAGHVEDAIKIMEDNKKVFDRFDGVYNDVGIIIAYSRILEYSNKMEYEKALALIEKIRSQMGEKSFEEEYKLIKKALKESKK
ncbi:MAG TPA: hypothetical protein VIG40_06715 [Tissierellaceae bacterium]